MNELTQSLPGAADTAEKGLPLRPLLPDLDTPSVVIDLAIMENNLNRMAELCRAGSKALRPHVKTHKIPALAHRQLQGGAVGITVAKLSEAEVMAKAGVNDILVAYEVIGGLKMQRLLRLLNGCPDLRLALAIDTVAGATRLSNAVSDAGVSVEVLIEIDTGLGRAGVRTVEEAVSLARHLRLFPGLRLRGILTHEGQVYRGTTEEIGPAAGAAAEQMNHTAEAIRALGMECPVVSMGSTPGAPYLAAVPGVTELRPGTYIFNDRTEVALGAAEESNCALTVLATVVSVQPGERAVLDAGSKALTSDAVPRFGTYGAIIGDPGARLAGCSEEHGHLDLRESNRQYAVGDRVHILPNHVCPVVNLTDSVYGYRGYRLEVEWPVAARGCVR